MIITSEITESLEVCPMQSNSRYCLMSRGKVCKFVVDNASYTYFFSQLKGSSFIIDQLRLQTDNANFIV